MGKVSAKKIDLTSICSIELGELGSIIKCFRTYVPSVGSLKLNLAEYQGLTPAMHFDGGAVKESDSVRLIYEDAKN